VARREGRPERAPPDDRPDPPVQLRAAAGFGGTLLGAAIDLLDIDTASLTGPGTVTELLRGAPAPWRSDRDFMRVTSFGQTTLRDPDNPKLAMVAVDLRCAFTRGLPVAWDAMLLQSVTVRDKLTGAH
jgi:hypothetical protein